MHESEQTERLPEVRVAGAGPLKLYLGSLLILLLGVMSLSTTDDALGQLSLHLLTPVIVPLVWVGDLIGLPSHASASSTIAVVDAILILLAAVYFKRQRDLSYLIFGLACALTAQWLLSDKIIVSWFPSHKIWLREMRPHLLVFAAAGFLYLNSLRLWWRHLRLRWVPDIVSREDDRDQQFRSHDAWLLAGATLIAIILRFYGLNQVTNVFEGELACYSAGATSLSGMLQANRGAGGPWAPLGLLYYPPIYLTTQIFGTTLLSLRMSSALIGVLTIPLMYLFATRVAGRLAGHFAAFLLAINELHVGWGRTDIHPHGVTVWPSLLLGTFLLRAYRSQKDLDLIWVVLAMGLTWHQYPSGQSAVAMPLVAVAFYLLANRKMGPFPRPKTTWRLKLALFLGVALWAVGLPFSYYLADGEFVFRNPFNQTGPRALWGGVSEHTNTFNAIFSVIAKSIQHLSDVLIGIFYKVPYLFHQDFVLDFGSTTIRTVSWMITPLCLLGLFLILRAYQKFESAVMLGWLAVAILPGILSEHAYPKRLSTFFPAFETLAAIALAYLYSLVRDNFSKVALYSFRVVLVIALSGYFAFAVSGWFSGRQWRYGEPGEVGAAELMAAEITPRTIVIADFPIGYHDGKMTYLLLDHLTDPANRPNRWITGRSSVIEQAFRDPLNPALINFNWPYSWTKLRDQVTESQHFEHWERIVFFLQEPERDLIVFEERLNAAVRSCSDPKIYRIPAEGSFWKPLTMVSCNLKSRDSMVSTNK